MIVLCSFVVAAVVVAQGKEEMDGYRARRIYEAVKCAETWSYMETERLYPTLSLRQYRGDRIRSLEYNKLQCRPILLEAAKEQICKAYKVSRKQLQYIMDRPFEVRRFPFSPDVPNTITGNDANYLLPWEKKGTLFDPEKVRLSPKLAKRFGYRNPIKTEEEKVKRVQGRLIEQLLEEGEIQGPPDLRERKHDSSGDAKRGGIGKDN